MNKFTLALIVVAGLLLYLRSPIDLIPDRAGGVGLLDDLAALGLGIWYLWRRLPRMPSGQPGSTSSGEGAGRAGQESSGSGALDPWQVLEIAPGASAEEVRHAYREKLRQYHPDRVDGLGEEFQRIAHQRTLEIRAAYEELQRQQSPGPRS